jgi:FG-GAP-like repeat/CHAP domain
MQPVLTWTKARLRRLMPLLLTLGLLMGGTVAISVATSAPASATDSCGNPGPPATGVLLAGSSWLNGGGVNVYENLQSDGSSYGDVSCYGESAVNNINGTPEDAGGGWQCVELVNRFYLTKGWIMSHWYGNGDKLVDNLPSGLTKQNNGQITSIVPGDVVTFNGNSGNSAGHAGIVSSVSGTSVTLVNQNAGTAVMQTVTYNPIAGTLTGEYGYSTQAVIHAAANTGSTPPPPPDQDGDAIPNSSDVCVDTPGIASLDGCPQRLALFNGDFNGDGKQDVAALYAYPERGNAMGLFVWPGNGDGIFGAPVLAWYTASGWDGGNVISAGAGDFNKDGYSDISVIYSYPDTTSIKLFEWFGNASLNFADPTVEDTETAWAGADVIPIGVGDFNGDGNLDIAVFYRYPDRGNYAGIYIWYGNGEGTFQTPQLAWYSSGWDGLHIIPIGVGDFDHNGESDIVAIYEYPGTSIKLWEWSDEHWGTFPAPTVEDTESGWEGFHVLPIGVGDFNGDGNADVAVFYRYPERGNAVGIFVWYGNGNGTFGAPQQPWYTSTGWDGLHVIPAGVGDYDGNGQSDITAFYEYPDTVTKLFELHDEHWGSFPSTDPAIQDTESEMEGYHLIP